MPKKEAIRIALISLHGLIRGNHLELGRDEDTGVKPAMWWNLRGHSPSAMMSHILT